jgi:hypothetical protein
MQNKKISKVNIIYFFKKKKKNYNKINKIY